jgi:hypothetical protein
MMEALAVILAPLCLAGLAALAVFVGGLVIGGRGR